MNDKIPFLDLITPHRELEQELTEVFRQALHTAGFIGGPMVEGFEQEFASFCRTKYCIGVGSGTDALRFALMAAGVKQGDIVITVANTFIATTEAITQAGASIAFVDVDEKTYTMDPARLRKYIEANCRRGADGRPVHAKTGQTVSAIVPVHLYGQMCDMDPIMAISKEWNLKVIEDACQAHGAEYFSRNENRWRTAGSMGHAAAFSFYPGKNLGACGEAGAVTTDDRALTKMIKMIRDHGQAQKYYHDIEGYNGRLDAIQAGILRVKLRNLAEWNDSRRRISKRYNEMLRSVQGVVLPYEPEASKSVYHLYVIRVKKRDELQKFLASRNIATGLHYPLPLHQQKAYAEAKLHNGGLPVSESASREILSLPMFPGLTEQQQTQVAQGIRDYFRA